MFFALILFVTLFSLNDGSHFRGGIVSWRALNTNPSGSTADILIHQRYSWRRSFWSGMCTTASIATQTIIGSGTGSSISTDVACTDFSVGTDFSSGERYDVRVMDIGQTYILSYRSNAWFSLAMGGGGDWQMTGKVGLNIRPDGKINTSPVTSTLPIIYREINVQHVHIVQMADADSTDTLRYPWLTASGNTNGYNQCRSVCAPSLPPGYTLFSNYCTLVFLLNDTDYFGLALQIEDFYTSSSSTPMSSVPIQFLFYGQPNPDGSCTIPPSIIGVGPSLACIGIQVSQLIRYFFNRRSEPFLPDESLNETVIAQVGCPGYTIIDFTTSLPTGMSKTTIKKLSPGIYSINLLWIPSLNQYGPQGFCAGAMDNANVQSVPWCVTFLVGFTAPNLQPPVVVQGSASPVKIMSPSIDQDENGNYVYFTDATANTTVLSIDCGWSPQVTYSGDTIIIYAPFPWVPRHRYYITFESGATSGTEFCRAESAAINDPNFSVFDVWDPGFSSTTSTTALPPTLPIGQNTTTPVANLTITGVIITSSTSGPTTTRTTSSSTTSTTMTTVTQKTTASTTRIMTRADFIKSCEQPVAVGTVLTVLAVVPIII